MSFLSIAAAHNLPSPPNTLAGWPWQVSKDIPSKLGQQSYPKISVVMPSLNQGQFLEAAIRSVLLQNYPEIELIIIDGLSQDNSLEIITKYESWITYWVSELDRGQSHAINKGLEQITGDVVLWLNSDDICLPGVFHLVGRVFDENPGLGMLVGQAIIIDSHGKRVGELRSSFSTWEELATNPRNSIRQVSTFFCANLFKELGGVDETLHIAMDSELLVRLTKIYHPYVVDDYLTAYREHPGTKTSGQLVRGYLESDLTRPKYLKTPTLLFEYRKRSAENWLSLVESGNYTGLEKSTFWLRALALQPVLITRRSWWATLYRMIRRTLNTK